MEKVEVLLGKNSYDIVIGHDILDKITDYTKKYDKILVISNDTIGKIYKDRFVTILQKESKDVYFYEIIDGEEYKKIDTVLPIYDYMIENNFDRSSLVISLGGGVVCDLTGYVAATFMRGLDFIQIPTSLLAQVDASVGGKVAVNHPKGKNLIGAFY
ncbi:MAG: iron-containing alcohol dehydrogenase, partial [Fusobacteria bacterium]|nr:iron-containing alcohol dehydrogenase [Fusobacteriota bacterium]